LTHLCSHILADSIRSTNLGIDHVVEHLWIPEELDRLVARFEDSVDGEQGPVGDEQEEWFVYILVLSASFRGKKRLVHCCEE
jgi:hypothetical protein